MARHLMSELADTLRIELSGEAPGGFASAQLATMQSEEMDRLTERLMAQHGAEEISAALAALAASPLPGWTYLKLLELAERFPSAELSEALLKKALNPPDDVADERRLFLAGRTYEVLLKQPLTPEVKEQVSLHAPPALGHLRRLREVADARMRGRKPSAKEWAIAFGTTLLALAGMAFAWHSLP